VTDFLRRNFVWLAVVAISVAALIGLPVPYVKQSPGPVFNTIGTFDDKPLIEISGVRTYQTEGTLDLVTVSERGGPFGVLLLGEAMLGWLDPDVAVVPKAALYPEEITKEQARTRNRVAFGNSQGNAVAAALGFLGLPIKNLIVVGDVIADGPSDGLLLAGDQIIKVQSGLVANTEELVARVRSFAPGELLVFDILREGKDKRVEVKSGPAPDDTSVASVGIFINNQVEAEFDIDFALESIGGPSAGLMFALGIIDELTPGNLNNGKKVAGTGTVTPDGDVGRIGGLWQKLAAASDDNHELFLLPAANCDDVKRSDFRGMPLIPVTSLDQAVEYLEIWASKGADSLPRCA
jgi:PDZ domain-containing protein